MGILECAHYVGDIFSSHFFLKYKLDFFKFKFTITSKRCKVKSCSWQELTVNTDRLHRFNIIHY